MRPGIWTPRERAGTPSRLAPFVDHAERIACAEDRSLWRTVRRLNNSLKRTEGIRAAHRAATARYGEAMCSHIFGADAMRVPF